MKHGKKIAWILTGAILSAGCITGCSKEPADAPSNTYHKVNLSMAVNGTDTQIDSLVANHFAQLVNERSEGNVTIDVFPNDTLAGGNSTKGVEYIATGGSDLGAYATSKALHDIGAVNGKDMTTEAALTKLYYLFSLGLPKEEIKEKMAQNLRGELTE